MIPIKRLAAFTLISGGIALGTLAVAQSATALPLNIVDNGDGTATGYWQLPATGTWPQSAINPGALCGVVQADVYPYASPADKARTDALAADSTLTEGEDYGWPTSWTIKEYPACATTPSTTPSAPVTPPPVPTSGVPSPSPTVSVPVVTESPTPPVVTSPPSPVETSAPAAPVTSSPAVPSKTTSPTPTATSTSTSTPAASASNRNGTGTTVEPTYGSNELAYTGANTGPAIGGAVALLIGGLVMLALGKKGKKA